MRTFNRPVPTVSTALPDIIGTETNQVSALALQAPAANVGTIFFGNKSEQPFELRPEANAILPINQIRDVHIWGTVGDRVSIGLF